MGVELRGVGGSKGPIFRFFVNNSKTMAYGKKMIINKIEVRKIIYKKGPLHFFARINTCGDMEG